jgi:hypothetical protein
MYSRVSGVVEGIRGYTAYTRQKNPYTDDFGKKMRVYGGRTQVYAAVHNNDPATQRSPGRILGIGIQKM